VCLRFVRCAADLQMDAGKALPARPITTISCWRDRDEHATAAAWRGEVIRVARLVHTPDQKLASELIGRSCHQIAQRLMGAYSAG
jgi:hypothetical protein